MERKISVFGHEKAEVAVQAYIKNLSALEELYAATGNPLFVWEALAVMNFLLQAQRQGLPVPPLPPIPEWTVEYLLQSAGEIAKLAGGDASQPGTNPSARVPHALGLVSGSGTNRFVEHRRMRRAVDTLDLGNQLRKDGLKGDKVDAGLKTKLGDKDGSVFSKARAEGRTIRKRIQVRLDNGSEQEE